VFAAGLIFAWLLLALSMQAPPAVRTRMYHVNTTDAARLSAQLGRLDGVVEAVVDANEGVVYLKVRLGEWDETGARNLIEEEE
jgi:hypothetical protein